MGAPPPRGAFRRGSVAFHPPTAFRAHRDSHDLESTPSFKTPQTPTTPVQENRFRTHLISGHEKPLKVLKPD
jgi:hypothetical protein